MLANFRLTMTWIHTWFGLVLGYVLMACFFFGSLAVFDREIDRWAIPDTRFAPQPMPSYDNMMRFMFEDMLPHPSDMAATANRVKGALPAPEAMPMQTLYAFTTHRDPVLRVGAEFGIPNEPLNGSDEHEHVHGWGTLDPRSGKLLAEGSLRIGSEWFYPLHYNLNLHWGLVGYFLVGLAGFIMMVALVTGVIMHRKIFREFFTFRPAKKTQRSTLDLHNMTGVIALPFHFFFAFTGVLIFAASIFYPVSGFYLTKLHDHHEAIESQRTGLPLKPAGIAAPLASVDAMMEEAKRIWAARDMAGEVGYLRVEHLGDRNSYVSIYRAGSDRVIYEGTGIHFNGSTGAVILEDPPASTVGNISSYLMSLHLQHFEHWPLRWLYVLGGLLGCVCIATGFIFFVEKRKRRHAEYNNYGCRVVDALAVTAVTGMVIAAVAMLVANRLLPVDIADKGQWEVRVFWGAWGLALVHAALRSGPVANARINPAWKEQCLVLAALAVAAPVLNGWTTGDHLIQTLFVEPFWPVAGLDLCLLGCAAVSLWAARKLSLADQSELRVKPTLEGVDYGRG
ncbi:MAG: PepSY-associated TM helix domain-containing protein [Pseudomonadota bacterium]|nr:PepSY-associated TM helix domain-containing protein [Pseudomonadota bacterium]